MNLLKCPILLILVLSSSQIYGLRSDSIALKSTALHLTIKDFANKKIYGYSTYNVHFIKGADALHFDLSSLTTDSIVIDNIKTTFTHTGDRLTIALPKTYAANDSCSLTIYYGGTPAADPGGWGGFYFSGTYAFNLGVGFTVNPHSYGRAWFPCIDEFTMKSRYDFYITSASDYTAACNGLLKDTIQSNGNITWHFSEANPMSAYLASVSVSKYSVLKSSYNGMAAQYPLWLHCATADTNKVKQSFVNLPKALTAFEKAFGPQPYSKVGYNMVPFSSGAMEHAGNITYPALYADGSTNYETLLAHELSHHWWGNAVTCADAGDMWMNEGWASYCEHFFTEQVYGRAAYNASIASNHYYVLRYAHINDGQAFPMVNIPHTQTYGTHVYKKGADVVHSLRSVMGDSAFFKACKAYQQQYRWGNANTAQMQAVFEQNGGGIKATAFFDNWIKEKGQPHVIISKQVHSGNGPYRLHITTYQKPRFTEKLYTNLPMEVFFFKDKNTFEKRIIFINNMHDTFSFNFSFKPVLVCLDYEQKLSDAITAKNITTAAVQSIDVPEASARIITKKIRDTAFIRLEHHWTGPEKYTTTYPAMSNYRYLTLDGIWHDSVSMDLEITYDGRQPSGSSNVGWLDHTLIFKTEDSLAVMYRGFPGDYWRPWTDVLLTTGSKTDKFGKILVRNARKGDYVLAMYDRNLAFDAPVSGPVMTIFPNPAGQYFDINIGNIPPQNNAVIEVFNTQGQCVFTSAADAQTHIDTSQWNEGLYLVRYRSAQNIITRKIIITR